MNFARLSKLSIFLVVMNFSALSADCKAVLSDILLRCFPLTIGKSSLPLQEKRILKHSRILKGKLFMLSNSRSQAALHIYHKYGFKEIKSKDYEYERGDIAFELTVNQ